MTPYVRHHPPWGAERICRVGFQLDGKVVGKEGMERELGLTCKTILFLIQIKKKNPS